MAMLAQVRTSDEDVRQLPLDEQVELFVGWLDERPLTAARAKILKEFIQRQHIQLLKLQRAMSAEERIRAYFAAQGLTHGDEVRQ